MAQYYQYLVDLLKGVENGSETLPEDDDFKLALHELYSNKECKKLNVLVNVLAGVHFKKGKSKNYFEAWEEAVIDLIKVYKIINDDYFNGKEKENIKKFYKNSIEKFVQAN